MPTTASAPMASSDPPRASRTSRPTPRQLATSNPAGVVARIPKHGTLQIGAPADLSILELVEGPVSFVDTRNNIGPAPL